MQRILLSSGAQERTIRFRFGFRSASHPNVSDNFQVIGAFKFPAGIGTRVEATKNGNTVKWLNHEENAWQHDYVTGVIQANSTDPAFFPETGSYGYYASSHVFRRVGLLAAVPDPTTFYNLGTPTGCIQKCQSWLSECQLGKNPHDSTFTLSCTISSHHWASHTYKVGINYYTAWREASSKVKLLASGKLDALGGILSFSKFEILDSELITSQDRQWLWNVVAENNNRTLPKAIVLYAPTFNGVSVSPPILPASLDTTPIEKWPERLRASCDLEEDNGDIFRGIIDALSQCAEVHCFSIENCNDIFASKETIEGLLQLTKDGVRAFMRKNPLLILRVLCACHIVYRYVIKTSLKDGEEFIRVVKLLWKHRAELTSLMGPLLGKSSSSRSYMSIYGPVSVTQRINVVLGRDSWSNGAYNRLKGIALTPGMFWDAVPLSFVLDWFLPIGDLISSWQMWYDYNNQNTNVLATVLGVNHRLRRIVKFGTTHRFYGEVVSFTRKVVAGPMQCNTAFSFALKNPFKQSFTAFSLLIQVLVKRP